MGELLYLRGGGQGTSWWSLLKNAKKSLRSGQQCSKPGGIRFLGSKWAYGVVFFDLRGSFSIYCLLHVF